MSAKATLLVDVHRIHTQFHGHELNFQKTINIYNVIFNHSKSIHYVTI